MDFGFCAEWMIHIVFSCIQGLFVAERSVNALANKKIADFNSFTNNIAKINSVSLI